MANEKVLAEIDSVLAEYEAVEQQYKKPSDHADDGSFINAPAPTFGKITSLLRATIARLAPPQSSYISETNRLAQHPYDTILIRILAGILQALRADYAADRIRTFQELVHSDLFADLLEAAEYLHGEGWKDAAAVMAGGVLEQHLRELCRKHGVDPAQPSGKPKMLDALNADLAKASAYGKIEQKEVTAWAGLRNAAAHGQYGDYDANQVGQMITGIREFIIRHPA